MKEDKLLYEQANGIGRVTLNRPEALNALDREMMKGLSALFRSVRDDEGVRAVIITGSGEKAFSAGADIRFLSQASPLEVRQLALLAVEVNDRIENCGKVVLAAINGHALGGGLELAEACMLRVAAPHARLGHPEVALGAIAGWGGTTRLPRLVGKGRAAELLLTGRQLSAQEALETGLVNRVAQDGGTLLQESEQLLGEILSQAPLSVKMTWDALHRGLGLSPADSALLGADYFGLIASSGDFREGTGAFLEKRKPRFRGT